MGRKAIAPVCVSLLLVALLVSPASAVKPVPPPVFQTGLHLTADFPYGLVQAEPSVRVDQSGRIYVIAPGSTPIGCEVWIVAPDARSATFHPPDLGAGGGDCDLALTDPAVGSTYQKLAYSSLSLADLTVGVSTDGGSTFSTPNPAGSQIVGTDRQWNAGAEGSTVYMAYHIVETNNIAVARSTDGGQTYVVRGLEIDPAHIAQAAYNNSIGPIVVDNSSLLSPRPVYGIFTAPASALENANSAAGTLRTFNHAVYLGSSFDGGATWTDTPIYVGPDTETYDHIFPALGIDSSGGLWAAWASAAHIYMTHAGPAVAGAFTWSPPVQIDATGATANLYPWIVGGGADRADLVWYAGTGVDNNDPANQWTVRYAQLAYDRKGALTVAQAVASDHVIHHGQICTFGVSCTTGGDRTLLDFFQVGLTPDGRAAIAWADDSAAAGVGQIYVTEQCAGVSALSGAPLVNRC